MLFQFILIFVLSFCKHKDNIIKSKNKLNQDIFNNYVKYDSGNNIKETKNNSKINFACDTIDHLKKYSVNKLDDKEFFKDLKNDTCNKNKVALITGAANGLGKNLTLVLLEKNWKVIGVDIDIEELNKFKKTLGDKSKNFICLKCDITKQEEVKKSSDNLKKRKLYPTIFFLNAGIHICENEAIINMKKGKFAFNLFYFGVMYWVEQWMEHCLKHKGIFVCTSSLAIKQPFPYVMSYTASKSAITSAFESLRIQYYNTNLKFITVLPGNMTTKSSTKNVPFSTETNKAARHIIKNIFKGKQIIAFPLIHEIALSLLPLIPTKIKYLAGVKLKNKLKAK